IAKTEAYPESAHNDIVVWQKNQNLKIGYILFESEGKLCSILTNLLNEIYIRQNKTLVKISPRGNNLFSKLMQGSLLAGYVSVYLAKMKGVDTTDTSITGEYKKSLEKANLV
ncbi:MAG: SIS domain-containing protein, partial [Caldisphaera sp.]|nr:SIS domain-containing protein [Caldisphaera sp.]